MRSDILSFTVVPVTVVTVLFYLLVLIPTFWADHLPGVPKNQKGLNIKVAYDDLHHIAARPHPYNSHANDQVRAYILDRLEPIADNYTYVHISNDLTSTAAWKSNNSGVYFEGTNILVKIDGTDPDYRNKGGALFSAHYDSVSTAPGVTDDGMGVSTLIQLVHYFAEHRQKRTAIFNINNGEEDGLNGAQAFLKHPWAKIPDVFLNLEGAAAGGRPLLFRSTSSAVTRAFRSKYVPHPHANVISADGFKRGFIRSGTDYTVYSEGAGMQGLDLAFYKGRSKYHTKYDAIPFTEGQQRSLWAMMASARGAGIALLNDDGTHDPEKNVPAVYFDLFSSALILFRLESLYLFNILFLILGPIILVSLLFLESYMKVKRRDGHQPAQSHIARMWADIKDLKWSQYIWQWSKFWVAILVTVALQALLILVFLGINPFIVYSHPYAILLSITALTYAVFTSVLNLDLPFLSSRQVTLRAEKQNDVILLQSYFLSWILLLLSTIAIGTAEVGGVYFITYWSLGLWVACGLASLETVFRMQSTGESDHPRDQEVPTERTPLINDQQDLGNDHQGHQLDHDTEGDRVLGWWLLQFLLTVPAPVIMIAQIGNLLIDASNQTLADGSNRVVTYALAALTALFLVIPLAPFTFRLPNSLRWIFLVVFIVVALWTAIWASPFSQETPLKVFFQQSVQLEGSVSNLLPFPTGSNLSHHSMSQDALGTVKSVTTTLTGVEEYLENIISHLPSSGEKNLVCSKSDRPGLRSCTWDSGLEMLPSTGSAPKSGPEDLSQRDFFRAEVTRVGLTTAEIVVRGKNTRNCRLYFDNHPIVNYTVLGPLSNIQDRYEVSNDGMREVKLWSRDWDNLFAVTVQWRGHELGNTDDNLRGRIACEWAEYASSSVGVPGEGQKGKGGFRSAKIPAYEEVLMFLPKWVTATKSTDGLVEAWEAFEV